MRLHQLEYLNFGPFKGRQTIDLPEQNGVSVIYGDNNLGKTTILNSVRWLFIGKFLERTGKTRNDRELVNREAVAEARGEPVTAKVSAIVTWRGEKYTLTRSVTLQGDKLTPLLSVVKGSYGLSAEAGLETLRQMIPEEIQQFFLFDAEALNRYEDLLHDSAAGEELKSAIERILGVPVLKNAIQDLRSLTEKHTRVISKLETQDAKAKAAEPPWCGRRVLSLEARLWLCLHRDCRGVLRRGGIRLRRRPRRCGWCASCAPSWALTGVRSSGLRSSSATGWSRCGPGCARPMSMTARCRV